jgi:amidase
MRVAITVSGAASGPLAGARIAVKDIIDVAGVATGAGNPDWLARARPAQAHATAVARLLDAGATVVGKAITDEFAYSLRGVNAHYGTPRNPGAPGRIPGGSSSGSASAVALGIADVGLGTDTGGSIRVPASYCGLYGFRPTHGRVPMDGILPLAPTFDTCGALAARGDLLLRTGLALLGVPDGHRLPSPSELVIAVDLLELADSDAAAAVRSAAVGLAERLGCPITERVVAGERLTSLPGAFRDLQQREVWASYGPFISKQWPRLGIDIADRFAAARTVSEQPERAGGSGSGQGSGYGDAREIGREILAALPPGAARVLPSAAAGAPGPVETPEAAAATRERLVTLTCLAGITGAPQVSLPLCRAAGLPVGLGLLARPGEDEMLLAAAAACG